jgi:ribosome-binding protein aMBF1 (putative translation factor)
MAFPVRKLEVERRKRFMSQWDLARATGIIQTRLSLIERGEVKPKEQEIGAIGKALGISLKEVEALILENDGEKEQPT